MESPQNADHGCDQVTLLADEIAKCQDPDVQNFGQRAFDLLRLSVKAICAMHAPSREDRSEI